MRKFNAILSLVLLVIILLHGILGSFMLVGVGGSVLKFLTYLGVLALLGHTILGAILTVKTFKPQKKCYLKQNAIFWLRRASGLAILILVGFHVGAFGTVQGGKYILFEYTARKFLLQLLLILSLLTHAITNVKPLLISLGVTDLKQRTYDITLALSIVGAFMIGAVVLYYVRWLS